MPNHRSPRLSSTIVAWTLFVVGTYSWGITMLQSLHGVVVFNLSTFTVLAGAGLLWNQQWARVLGFAVCCFTFLVGMLTFNSSSDANRAVGVIFLSIYGTCGVVIARDYLAYTPTRRLCERCGADIEESQCEDETEADPRGEPAAH
ncbi:MAG TPA: hypothetical protein VK157_15850 [Phycisphaerales bacterium]|nr:hypothetical protein [Phycisphaerales bacterium]